MLCRLKSGKMFININGLVLMHTNNEDSIHLCCDILITISIYISCNNEDIMMHLYLFHKMNQHAVTRISVYYVFSDESIINFTVPMPAAESLLKGLIKLLFCDVVS